MVSVVPDLALRRADESDVASLSVLSIETWLSTYATHGVSDEHAQYVLREFSPERFLDILRTEAATILVGQSGPFIGGYARFSAPGDPDMVQYGSIELKTLYVRPAQHRQGLGSALLTAVFSQCRADGATGVFLTVNSQNDNAIAFYEAMGMSECGEYTFMFGALAVPNQVFSLLF